MYLEGIFFSCYASGGGAGNPVSPAELGWDLNTGAGTTGTWKTPLWGSEQALGWLDRKATALETISWLLENNLYFYCVLDARSGCRCQDSEQDAGKYRGAKAKWVWALDNWQL